MHNAATIDPRDVEIAFDRALAAAGLRPYGGALIPGDGVLHRYRLADDKPNRKNGWAILHTDRTPHGEAGSWRTEARLRWTPDGAQPCAVNRASQERAQRDRERERDREAASIAHTVRAIWRSSRPAAATIAEEYLREHRGIRGIIPPTIRCTYALRHAPSGLMLPAMVAAVAVWPSREIAAIHRTYLDPETADKAKVEPVKMMLGPVAGGAVRLAEVGGSLAISEGIETGLVAQYATGIPTWAALSAGGMEAVVLPDLPLAREIWILADNDKCGRGMQAARRLARRAVQEGRTVRIAGADWADVLAEARHVA